MTRVMRMSDGDFSKAYARLIALRGARLDAAEAGARAIVDDVRLRGMEAVRAYTAKFDGMDIAEAEMRVSDAEVNAAFAACEPDLIRALERAAERIGAFHARERPSDGRFVDDDGVLLGWRWRPVDAAGVYAPGGLAAYPSSVLMNAAPAKAAGVERIAMATPPGRLFDNPAILAAAKIAGVTEIWKIGGAQAIAALAYGAGPLDAVDVVVGPGRDYVAAAKRIVYGAVGVDAIAGPSEVFIACDGDVDPAWIAADLLAQAEHDEDAQSVLFTQDEKFAGAVAAAVEGLLASERFAAWARTSWERHGAIVVTPSLAAAIPLINEAAPEHVQIVARDAEALAEGVRHAGAIFLGAFAPEALGDYLAGPSHVLPTMRAARFSSGVTTQTFMKRTSLIGADRAALTRLGRDAALIADAERLPAHAHSLRIRLEGAE